MEFDGLSRSSVRSAFITNEWWFSFHQKLLLLRQLSFTYNINRSSMIHSRRTKGNGLASSQMTTDIHWPRLIFNKVMISPDDWIQVTHFIKKLKVFIMGNHVLLNKHWSHVFYRGLRLSLKKNDQKYPAGSILLREYVRLKNRLHK